MLCDSVNRSPFSLENWSQWRPRTIEMSDSFYYLVSPLFAPRQTNFRTLNAASVGTDICITLIAVPRIDGTFWSLPAVDIQWPVIESVMLLSLVKLIRTFYCYPREHFRDRRTCRNSYNPHNPKRRTVVVVIGPWSIGTILVGKQPTIIISTITSPPFLRGCIVIVSEE